jgi:xanthine dehydrogenase small subunit
VVVIQFLLNGQSVSEVSLRADTTLLQYLRTGVGLVGTKEGCASGDCGACTVLLGRWRGTAAAGHWAYESVNSCLLLLAAVHGAQVLTVEALASGDTLHPAQQAMVDCSGSQCGFCTPGFVMSLAGMYLQGAAAPAPLPAVQEAISGNLCRCTGYKPILAAARSLHHYPVAAPPGQTGYWEPRRDILPQLGELPPGELPVSGNNASTGTAFISSTASISTESLTKAAPGAQAPATFVPQTETALQQLLQQYPQAHLVGGGTDANLAITQRFVAPATRILTTQVAELQTLEETPAALLIGAAVSYQRAAAAIGAWYPEARALLGRIGSLQIRHTATLAGNLASASPIGDGAPMLMAMQAQVEIGGGAQVRQCAVAELITGYRQTCLQPGEYIRRILIPRPQAAALYRFIKVSKRVEDDISTVLLAACISLRADGHIASACLAFGGMAATPRHAAAAEALLLHSDPQRPDPVALAAALQQDFSPIGDVRASAAYRQVVAQQLLVKVLLACAGSSEPTSVWSAAG